MYMFLAFFVALRPASYQYYNTTANAVNATLVYSPIMGYYISNSYYKYHLKRHKEV